LDELRVAVEERAVDTGSSGNGGHGDVRVFMLKSFQGVQHALSTSLGIFGS